MQQDDISNKQDGSDSRQTVDGIFPQKVAIKAKQRL
jgi:hypothetical protein